jgi:hypothetical protein
VEESGSALLVVDLSVDDWQNSIANYRSWFLNTLCSVNEADRMRKSFDSAGRRKSIDSLCSANRLVCIHGRGANQDMRNLRRGKVVVDGPAGRVNALQNSRVKLGQNVLCTLRESLDNLGNESTVS